MAIKISIIGLPGVTKELMKAANRYQTPSQTRKVIRPAAQLMQKGLRSTVSSTFAGSSRSTGNLARSIRIFQIARARSLAARRLLFVGANLGDGGRWPDGYYFNFQDQGTRKGIRAKYMMDRAVSAHGSTAANLMAASLVADLKYLT